MPAPPLKVARSLGDNIAVVVEEQFPSFQLKLPVFPSDHDKEYFFKMNGAAELFAVSTSGFRAASKWA